MANVNIVLGAEGSPENGVNENDEITWTNSTGYDITSFTLPTCVNQKKIDVPIVNGATTEARQVKNNIEKKSYEYSYFVADSKRGNRSGTIDVN